MGWRWCRRSPLGTPRTPRRDTRQSADPLTRGLRCRLQRRRGAALIVDYGSDRTYTDSLQAVKGHSYHPVLAEPGSADVSTSVDFRSLRPSHTGSYSILRASRPLMAV